MKRVLYTATLILLLAQVASGRAEEGFSDDVLRQALAGGRSLVAVRILGVRAEQKGKVTFYSYSARVQQVIIAGDLAPEDIPDPVDLYAGASCGQALTVGADYALFIVRDAPRFFAWAHRDDVARLGADADQVLEPLARRAGRIYTGMQLKTFREEEVQSPADLPALAERLRAACADFRSHPENRCASARIIAESDLGSRPDESRRFASTVRYLSPQVALTRAQVLHLLGKPTVKLGYTYRWFCGRVAEGQAGVLTVGFDPQGLVRRLVYGDEPLRRWTIESANPTNR
jgi:hypothetical protein